MINCVRLYKYQGLLDDYLRTDSEDTTIACDRLTDILCSATRGIYTVKTATTTRDGIRKRTNGNVNNPRIQQAKREFKKARRNFKGNEGALDRRALFIAAKRKYKTTVNRIQRYVKENKLQRLASIEEKCPPNLLENY